MKSDKRPEAIRVAFSMRGKDAKRFNDFCIKVTVKKGAVIPNIASDIAREAMIEYLDKHEKDV
jgi:hypothetical protein